MMLDDFFTSTEMNNGLTSPSRVMELVAVMQKGRNCTVVQAGDKIRQWSAVASAIAATENEDCLDLFIQLDGIQFIDKWLKDVQKFDTDSDKSIPEETIIQLLQALETLHMNHEKLVASEIWVTVKDLLAHGSSKVQGKARVLFESWKCIRNGVDSVSIAKVGALANDEMDESEHVQRVRGCSKPPLRYFSPSSDFFALEKGQELATNVQVPSSVSLTPHPGPDVGASDADKILDTLIGDDRASDRVVAPLSKPADGFTMCEPIGTTLVASCTPAVPRQDVNDDGPVEFPKLESTGDLIHTLKIECSPEKLILLEEYKRSEHKAMSPSSDAADANNSVMEHKNQIFCNEGPPSKINFGGKDVMDDGSYENKCRNSSPDLSCQVAVEVERKAVDSKEQSCSSEKPPEGNIRQPYDLDPVSENQSHDDEGSHHNVMHILKLSAEASPMQELATCIENSGMKQTSSTQERETSQITEVAHEAEKDTIDLNQEICSEDIDYPGNQTGMISIVSASRDAAATRFPVSPMQFEGNLGWKGSAVKKDSPPASPCQSPTRNEDLTVEVIRSTSKPPPGFHEIYLNVTKSGDDNPKDLLHYKQGPVYSGLPSGKSSVETYSRKYECYDLDLNLLSGENGAPTDSRVGHQLPEEIYHHQSHSSPASSKQSLSIIDLNDQPFFLDDSSDNSIISIMGARVKVNSKDLVPQTIPSPNGRTPELTLDLKVCGNNNVASAPEIVASPFSSFYGSGGAIPYMVDSRGSPFISQHSSAGLSQPPFISNTMRSIPSDGAGPSRSSFDLNSGAMVIDGGRDPLVLRDFLNLSTVGSRNDPLGTNTVPTVGSVVNGKRKEPDNGLEHYPFRNYTSP